ncbi:MAG: hypothetical protein QM756_02495 [Polyangiaceae bacterium]
MRLWDSATEQSRATLSQVTETVLREIPLAAEYLVAVSTDIDSDVFVRAEEQLICMLEGGLSVPASRTEQQLYGLRGVTRRLQKFGPKAIPIEWLSNVAGISRSDNPQLAEHAISMLRQWVEAVNLPLEVAAQIAVVAASLRASASDQRVLVRANALRGLVAMQRIAPAIATEIAIGKSRDDPRIAIRRAIETS